jgi:hypothetical protein
MSLLSLFADVTRAHAALNTIRDGCSHARLSWPQGGKNQEARQRCLDCGAVREAAMGQNGWYFGKWEKEETRLL